MVVSPLNWHCADSLCVGRRAHHWLEKHWNFLLEALSWRGVFYRRHDFGACAMRAASETVNRGCHRSTLFLFFATVLSSAGLVRVAHHWHVH